MVIHCAGIAWDRDRAAGAQFAVLDMEHTGFGFDTVRQVVYPVLGEDNLHNLAAEFKASRSVITTRMQATYRESYTQHYRRGLVKLLEAFDAARPAFGRSVKLVILGPTQPIPRESVHFGGVIPHEEMPTWRYHRTARRDCASTLTETPPASRAFSTSSFTTEAGRSTTSPAAIWEETSEESKWMDMKSL